MKKNLLITGANGMLAKHLSKILKDEYSIRYLTRKVKCDNEFLWDFKNKFIDPNALKDVNIIVHLAGAPVADKRWVKKRKQIIVSSRVESAQLILNELVRNNIKIDSFISASAIGYYGTKTTENIFTEESEKGNDFLSNVCYQWEKVAEKFKTKNIANRIAIVRIGVIFSENGSALQKILNPIKLGLGAALGSGRQYIPWIHIYDLCNIFKYILNNKNLSGIYNAVSPEYTNNNDLTNSIGKILNRRIFLPNIPGFILKILLGEMSSILLKGSRVSSAKIISDGFSFKHNQLDKALNNLISE